MKTNLKKASQSLRDWLNKTEKTTGLEKSIIVTGILMSYALKSREEEKEDFSNLLQKKNPKKPAA